MSPRFSLEELSDQRDIEALMHTYATGIDTADYELVDSTFVPDGAIDYASISGPTGRWNPEIKSWSEGGGRYLDTLVRTDEEWRITLRTTAQDWMIGTLPEEMTAGQE
jgi:SnoaL-like domain